MRRLGAWGVSVALLWGTGAALAGPEEETTGERDSPPARHYGGLITRWVLPGGTAAETRPTPRADRADKAVTPAKPPKVVQEKAVQRAREEAKYLRRSEVCSRLRDIAEQTNDAELRKKAEQMEERAWAVYNERTKHLAAGRAVFESDRKTLENHLGVAPAPVPRRGAALITVPGKEGPATAKEDK